MKKWMLEKLVKIMICTGILSMLTGCGERSETEIILTQDFKENEVFRIENTSCYLPEIMVYLVNSKNRYNEIFGEQIWKVPLEDSTVGEEYKETTLARIAQIKVMNLLAPQYEVALTQREEELVNRAAEEYFKTLNSDEVKLMRVNTGTIAQLYREFAIANQLYDQITQSVQPEISDDEARAVSVKTILVKTYAVSGDGERIGYTPQQKKEAYAKILEARRKLSEGTDFDVVAADYNEDSEGSYSFGRGVMPQSIEEVAFDLDTGETSEIIETEFGYHILCCDSTFDRDATDRNKAEILKQRQQEEFNRIYEEYVQTLTANLNQTLWESITYRQTGNVQTTGFFEVYDRVYTDGRNEE